MNNGLVSGHETRFMQNSTKMLGGVEPLEIVRAGVRRQKLACKLEHTLFHHPMHFSEGSQKNVATKQDSRFEAEQARQFPINFNNAKCSIKPSPIVILKQFSGVSFKIGKHETIEYASRLTSLYCTKYDYRYFHSRSVIEK